MSRLAIARTVEFLQQLGHDALHVRTLGLQRAADVEIVHRALDKPSVILFRLADERSDAVNQRLAAVLAERLAELEAGVLILVEDTRYRVRKLPIGR